MSTELHDLSQEKQKLFNLEAFQDQWKKQLVELLGGEVQVQVRPVPAEQLPVEDLRWYTISTEKLAANERPALGAEEQGIEEIGRRILQHAGIEQPEQPEITNSFLELVHAGLQALMQAVGLKSISAEEVAHAPLEETEVSPSSLFYKCELSLPGVDKAVLYLACSNEFMELLDQSKDGKKSTQAAKSASAVEVDSRNAISSSALGNFELLLEVELPISISFGKIKLPLKEVLKLGPGSVVELNRLVDEPVDIVVNNCVIARGEVVVVDGNYGVRIKEVASKEQRLRSVR